MSAVSATALTALRVRVAAARLARSKVSSPGQVTKSLLSSSRDGSSRTYATRGIPFTASTTAYFPHPRLQARLSRLAAREIPISRAAAPDDDAQTRTTSSDKTTTEAPDPHLADDDESAGEGASGHDIVGKAQDKLNNIVADATDYLDDATDAVEEDDPIVGDPKGWDTSGAQNWDAKPTDEISSNEKSPAAYIAGEVGYSKFYPPEARDYAYKRRIMVAVDGSVESEHAVQWAVQHICRSGDLLYIVHCAISIDPRLATFYGPLGDQISDDSPRPSVSGTVTRKSQIAFPCDRTPHHPMYDESWAPKQLLEVRDQYFSAAVLRTEAMLDDVYKGLKEKHGEIADGGAAMTPFPQPIELDAVLETTWEPIADMVKRRAEQVDAEMLIVAHHSKKWWEEALAGSVAKYLIDNSDLNVVVVH